MDDIDYQIHCILEHFEFKLIHQVMIRLEWGWEGDIPTVADLKQIAKELLSEAACDGYGISTFGGFVATRSEDVLKLSFVLFDLDGIAATSIQKEDYGDFRLN